MYSSVNSWGSITLLLLSIVTPVVAEDWPSLRGPNFNGSAAVGDAAIATGPLKLRLVWKRSFGSGYSSAVTSGNRVICAMADAEAEQEFLVAMSAESGDTIWKTPTGKIMVGANGSFDGPIATPTVDGERAYHLAPHGRLAAYSLSDGTVIWSHDLKTEYASQPNFYGFGACPIIYDGLLVVPVGSPDGAVMAFNPATGDIVWKAGKDGAAFHAAVPVTVSGKTSIFVPGNTTLHSIDPKNGDLLWSQSHAGASGRPVFSVVPVPLGDGGLFINDSRDETTVLNTDPTGATNRWTGRDIRNSYCVPVMSGGLLCSYSSRFLVAVDPATGKRLWRTRTPGDGFVATIAGRLLSATLKGSLHVGDVSEQGFDEVASIQVFDSGPDGSDGLMWSLPSIAGRSVYLRSLGAIARIDVLPGKSQIVVGKEASSVAPSFEAFLETLKDSNNKQDTIERFLSSKSLPIIDGDHVHFVLQGDYDDVAVASELFGVRQERPMKKVAGTNLFYFGVRLPNPTRASYVYFADYKPVTDPRNDRRVVSTTLAGEMEPTFMGPATPLTFSWFQKGDVGDLTEHTDDPLEQLAGRIEQIALESKAMKETVNLSVYVPPGYDTSQRRYPIVFVHEGNVALQSGNQAAILDDLVRTHKVRPAIAVFIPTRFFPMQGPGAYPQMFGSELIPAIRKSYRISESRNDRASLSGGFGATLSLIATLPVSQQVGRIGCHSPFVFEMLHPMVQQLARLPNDRCDILVQWGEFEFRNPAENWNMAEQSSIVADFLKKGGHKVVAETIPTGSDWVCWRTQSTRMWQFLIGSPDE